jgi:hypothetical protein
LIADKERSLDNPIVADCPPPSTPPRLPSAVDAAAAESVASGGTSRIGC